MPKHNESLHPNARDFLVHVDAPPRGAVVNASPFRSLADLLSDPTLCEPPKAVVPRLAWQGRTTLLAGREKGGKSTAIGCAAACVSAGARFLDGRCLRGPALWVGLEEHVSDISARLQRFGADPAKVFIADRLARPFEELEAAAERLQPALVVVDTLAAFVEEMIDDAHASAAWTRVMLRFSRLAHGTGAAVVLLHHARKSDGGYRDSTAIGAGVDVILEMRAARSDTTVRHLKAKGRFPVEDSSIRFTGSGFELTAPGVALDARILEFVAENPGCSKRQAREGISGKTQDVGEAIDRLVQREELENRGGSVAFKLFVPAGGEETGHHSGTTSGTASEDGMGEVVPGSPDGCERGNRSTKTISGESGSQTLTHRKEEGTAIEVHVL